MTNRGRDPEWSIELLRGIAAAMVVLAHYRGWMAGAPPLLGFTFTGVDLFFVLSGFVFAPYFAGRALPLAPHLLRRFFRLYPLYALALLLYALLHIPADQAWDHFAAHLAMLHTLESKQVAFFYNPAFWSLPPEVEYYLLLPLLALLPLRGRPFALLFFAALALHLLVAVQLPADPERVDVWFIAGFHLPGLLIEFLVGVLAARIVATKPKARTRWLLLAAGIALWSACAWVFVALYGRGGEAALLASAWTRGNIGLIAAVAYALMVAAWAGWVPRPSAGLRFFALWAGNLSYGVYLLHNAAPLLVERLLPGAGNVLMLGLSLAITLVLAALLHITWERPLREFGRGLASAVQGPALPASR